MNISRRDMLKLASGAAAMCAVGGPLRALAAEKKIPLGIQLYSVRKEAAKDLPPVLEAIAEMGYEGVEYAGYYDHTAQQLRQLQDANGLKCCGTHTRMETLAPDKLEATIEFNQTIGNKYLIVPWLPPSYHETVDSVKAMADQFTVLAEKVKPHGMVVGYHAHGGDFAKLDGETAWDLLFSNCSDDVVMQLDLGNCIGGGGDPLATLRKFPGRSLTIHLKEHGGKKGAVIGEGDVDWAAVFRICETTGGTEWYIVEQEAYAGGPPLDSIRGCIENLREMGK